MNAHTVRPAKYHTTPVLNYWLASEINQLRIAGRWCTLRRAARRMFEARATLDAMESKLANEAKSALLAAARSLTPEQRLNAFLAHCQLMMELYAAGEKLRSVPEKPRT